jgi:hypothetical protein
MHSEAISVHSSDRRMSITCDQPALIRGNQRSSVASVVIIGNQRSSEVISGNQTHLGIRAKVNIRGN